MVRNCIIGTADRDAPEQGPCDSNHNQTRWGTGGGARLHQGEVMSGPVDVKEAGSQHNDQHNRETGVYLGKSNLTSSSYVHYGSESEKKVESNELPESGNAGWFEPMYQDGWLLEEHVIDDPSQLGEGVEKLETEGSNTNSEVIDHGPAWEKFCWDMVRLSEQVMSEGYPNARGARIEVESGWNLNLLESLLQGYEDKEVVEWLRFGWPVSRPPNWSSPEPTFSNHCSATEFPHEIQKYIDKEMGRRAVCGPFKTVPFRNRIGISPLSTREKKDSSDRRIIMDLSWPPGRSVNSGIAKDQFMGFQARSTFPTLDMIARRIAELEQAGQGQIFLFKVDLSGYFRQLPLDPGDFTLMGFTWKGDVFFDIVSPMGLRSAPFFAQRISNTIKYIHNQAGYFLFNYIDNFIGVEVWNRINRIFQTLIRLLENLGVKEVKAKRIKPTQCLNCVGTMVDAKNKMLFVLPERRVALMEELQRWIVKETCSLKDIQRLVGKLQFICTVVRSGRLFMSRMLDELRQAGKGKVVRISDEFRQDVLWWLKYLPSFDGTGILWMLHIKEPDHVAASDACLKAMGAMCGEEYIKMDFPEDWQGRNIAYLELLAVIVMCKVWTSKFHSKSVLIV